MYLADTVQVQFINNNNNNFLLFVFYRNTNLNKLNKTNVYNFNKTNVTSVITIKYETKRINNIRIITVKSTLQMPQSSTILQKRFISFTLYRNLKIKYDYNLFIKILHYTF